MTVARLTGLVLLFLSGGAIAHPLAPALLQVEHSENGIYSVLWRLSSIQAHRTAPQPQLPGHCRVTGAPSLALGAGTAVSQSWLIDCGQRGLAGTTIAVNNLETSGINVILRIRDEQAREFQALLSASQPAYLIISAQPWQAVLADYLQLGMEHLVLGPDHLLFLLGLLLLVRGMARLVLTLTAFTIGHSLTLSLATLGILQFDQTLMELCIAISLLVLARELLRKSPTYLGKRPAIMAGSFGLLHGMGFAGALQQTGLPQTEVVSALIGFNLGIEIAQLLIVIGIWLFTLLLRKSGLRMATLQPALLMLPAYMMGSLAILWCIERFGALRYTFNA